MAVKSNPFSFLAGMFLPSVSQKSLIYNEAIAMGLDEPTADRVAERAYRSFRNRRLFERYSTLLGQDRQALRTFITANAVVQKAADQGKQVSLDEALKMLLRGPATAPKRGPKAKAKGKGNKNALEVARRLARAG